MKTDTAKAPKPPKSPKPAKPKPAASEAQWRVRLKLEELAATGIEGERVNALEKLARLEKKADFSGPRPESAKDLFYGVQITKSAAPTPVATFDICNEEVASFVKWAVSVRFDLAGIWKTEHGKATLWLNVDTASVHGLAHLTREIAKRFNRLWQEFGKLPGATSSDARLFMRGLYDGMMQDERKAGEPLPARIVPTVKRGRKSAALPQGLAVHPYAIALPLGRGIRVSLPIGDLVKELNDAANPSDKIAA